MDFLQACINGNIDLVKKIYVDGTDRYSNKEFAFQQCCAQGHLEIAIYLYSLGIIVNNYDSSFVVSCNNGHFEMAKWLFSLDSSRLEYSKEKAFILSCSEGHLEIAQWIHSLNVNIHSKDESAFRQSCKRGQFKVAQWLHSLGADIHVKDEYAFRRCCKNGTLEMAQWLYSLGADIHIRDDFVFINSCRQANFEIARWLHHIDPMMVSKLNLKLNHQNFNYEALRISEESATLFRCIRKGEPFPPVDNIEENVLWSLYHNNMIDELTKLREQFSFIIFDIEAGAITNFAIKPFRSKSARKN